jgi:hypothetical protein
MEVAPETHSHACTNDCTSTKKRKSVIRISIKQITLQNFSQKKDLALHPLAAQSFRVWCSKVQPSEKGRL